MYPTTPTSPNVLLQYGGITKISKLYLQLLYRCQFRCLHCFQGERLDWSDAYTTEEATRLIDYFTDQFGTETVVLLGGEPLLHKGFEAIAGHCHSRGLGVEVCSNGYRALHKLRACQGLINKLRISVEGLEETNDHIRHPGAFREALASLELGRELGMVTGVTMTVTALNIDQVVPLARLLAGMGVSELKLHALRPKVGNAAFNDALWVQDSAAYEGMHAAIAAAGDLGIVIVFDDDLDPQCAIHLPGQAPISQELDRIEVEPNGEIYVSCKAVGDHSNAFSWDRTLGLVTFDGDKADTELTRDTPQVHYLTLGTK